MTFKNKVYIKNDLKYFFIFIFFFIIFFLYQLKILNADASSQLITGILILLIFSVSILDFKKGLYTFIFLIPIVNFLPEIMGVNYFMLILLLFFPLWLGFIIYRSKKIYENNNINLLKTKNLIFDIDIAILLLALTVIFILSLIITCLRYSNFYPFFTRQYHNLFINIKGQTSNTALYWILNNFFNYIAGFGFAIIIFNVINKVKEIVKILIILVSSTVISALVILYQNFYNSSYGVPKIWINSGRFNATFSDPNALGSFCVLIFPIFLIMIYIFKKAYQKIIFIIFLILFFILLFYSGSRSALIGVIFEILIFIVIWFINIFKKINSYSSKKKLISIISIILIFIILIGSLLVFLKTNNKVKNNIANSGVILRAINSIDAFKHYFKKDGFLEAIKSISNYRYIYWERAYQMGRDYPFSGVGIASYILELPDYNYRYNRGFQNEDYAGNYYLQVFAEFGIIGLFLILYLFFQVIKKFIVYKKNKYKVSKNKNEEMILTALFISFLSMVIILFFGPHVNFIEVQLTFWLIIGLILCFINLKSNNFIQVNDRKNTMYINDSFVNSELIKKYSRKIYLNNFQIIALCIIALIFAGNLLYNSLNSLSLNIKENTNGWKDKGIENTFGFYGPEDFGPVGPRWIGLDAHINLKKEGNYLIFPIKANNPDINVDPVYVKIYLDNKLFINLKLTDSLWHKLKFKLPKNDMGRISVTFICSRTWVPEKWGLNKDTRHLGVLVGQFEFSN